MGKKTPLLISCGIFREELTYLIRERGLDREVIFLDAALHVNFDKLKDRLIAALEKNREPGREITVMYGRCHPGIGAIVARYGAKRIAAVNCLEAMAGPEEVRRMNAEAKTFFLSAGWIENWEKMFALGKEDFGFDFREMFRDYRRIVLLETGVIPIEEEKVRRFSDFTGLPVERKRISLDRLLALIQGA